ncbi:hypothetical protein HK405_007119 [Cladochytrium tenue]|nr:hypothetical protein HK405_007119 [Cladochytrium tenue]
MSNRRTTAVWAATTAIDADADGATNAGAPPVQPAATAASSQDPIVTTSYLRRPSWLTTAAPVTPANLASPPALRPPVSAGATNPVVAMLASPNASFSHISAAAAGKRASGASTTTTTSPATTLEMRRLRTASVGSSSAETAASAAFVSSSSSGGARSVASADPLLRLSGASGAARGGGGSGSGGGASSDGAGSGRGRTGRAARAAARRHDLLLRFLPKRVSFAAMISLEIILGCVIVAGGLMIISYFNYTGATTKCLSQSEDAQANLTFQIQDAVTKLVSQEIDVNNYEVLWQYFYYQLTGAPIVAIVYYGDNTFGDYVGLEVVDYGTSDAVIQAEFVDVGASEGNTTRCPETCTSLNITTTSFYYINIEATYTAVTALSVNKTITGYLTKNRPWYKLASSFSYPAVIWTPPYVFANGVDIGITAAVAAFDSSDELMGVLAADITFDDLRVQLNSIKKTLTDNAFIFVFSTDGELFATSVANESTSVQYTTSSGATASRPKYTSEIEDTNTKAAASVINQTYPGLVDLPENRTYPLQSGLLFQHVLTRIGSVGNASLVLVVVAGAPTTDYTAKIDQTRGQLEDALTRNNQLMLSSAAGVAVFFMLMTIPMTIVFVGRPMQALARSLERVANYDFSVLRGSQSRIRSRVKEIWLIQNAFWNMVHNFSRGIAENRKLMNRNAAGLSLQTPTQGPSR